MRLLNILFLITMQFGNPDTAKHIMILKTGYNEKINNDLAAFTQIPHEKIRQYKGIDKFKLKRWLIQTMPINYKQKLFTKYLAGQLSLDKLNSIYGLHNYNLNDTIELYRGDLLNSIVILTGIDKTGNKIIVPDANNNGDFGDDKIYKYTKNEQDKCLNDPLFRMKLHNSRIKYQQFDGQKLVWNYLFAKILPYKNYYNGYDNELEKELEVVAQDNSFKYGYVSIHKKRFKFYFNNDNIFSLNFDRKSTLIGMLHNGLFQRETYLINQDIPLGNNQYIKFDKIDPNGKYIIYRKFVAKKSAGINVGQTFPEHDFFEYKTAVYQKIPFKKKYTLIDFWGSWCNPCIEGMPDLKKLYDDFSLSKGIDFFSIAYDEKNKAGKIDKILKEAAIPWESFIDDKNLKSQSFENLFNVYSYPTVIIVDDNRKVIFRSIGIGKGFTELKNFIKTL